MDTHSGTTKLMYSDTAQKLGETAAEAPAKARAAPPTSKRTPQPGDKRYGQSRITNGSALLPGIDGRNAWVRRCKDVIAAHLGDLGGADNTSAAERSLIRRAAVLTTELEQIEVKFATNTAAADDLDLYQRTAGNLRRLLEAVGIKRVPRDVVIDPLEYAAMHEDAE